MFRSVYSASPRVFTRASHYITKSKPKMTIPKLYEQRAQNIPITVLTAHDAISARMADQAGADIILVGDSLAMVAMGWNQTQEIELEDMVYHTRAVARGSESAFLVSDLPFGSYEGSTEQGVASALRMIKKGGAEMVKFEGGKELAPLVRRLSSFGIATMPHIGLTPQRQVSTGGFKVQGRTAASAKSILEDALVLQEAGATMLLLEGLPDRIAAHITSKLDIPTIGIGAGPGTNGQVLVQLDMLGGFDAFVPRFLKRYSDYLNINREAMATYCREVREGEFPAKEHCYTIKDAEYSKYLELAGNEFD